MNQTASSRAKAVRHQANRGCPECLVERHHHDAALGQGSKGLFIRYRNGLAEAADGERKRATARALRRGWPRRIQRRAAFFLHTWALAHFGTATVAPAAFSEQRAGWLR